MTSDEGTYCTRLKAAGGIHTAIENVSCNKDQYHRVLKSEAFHYYESIDHGVLLDGSIVKAHQHSAGLPNKEEQGIGKSVAGNTTKIHMAVDAHGLPIDFQITGGKFMIVKLHRNLSKSYLFLSTPLQIKAMIAKRFEIPSEKNHPFLLFQEKAILRLVIRIWIGAFINTDTWLKMCLPE